jgi:hypothetical protein
MLDARCCQHTQIPTRAAITTKARNVMATMGIMIQSLCASKHRVVAVVKAVIEALVVLGVAYCTYTYYKQWSGAVFSAFSELCDCSAWISSKAVAAIKQGLHSLGHTIGLTSVQVCVCLHLITALVCAWLAYSACMTSSVRASAHHCFAQHTYQLCVKCTRTALHASSHMHALSLSLLSYTYVLHSTHRCACVQYVQ